MPPPYFISFHSYGTRLHGDADGSVDRHHNTPGTPYLPAHDGQQRTEAGRMKFPPFILDNRRRTVVEDTLKQVCLHRGWRLAAVNVRTTHVHVVLAAPRPPEDVMDDLKAWCTRRLREQGLAEQDQKVWARHGSTRWLNSDNSFEKACRYVHDCQGEVLPRWEEENA